MWENHHDANFLLPHTQDLLHSLCIWKSFFFHQGEGTFPTDAGSGQSTQPDWEGYLAVVGEA